MNIPFSKVDCSGRELELVAEVLDASGTIIYEQVLQDDQVVFANMDQLLLWELDNPVLYHLRLKMRSQDRITDHRIGLDVFGIENVLMGNCDRIFDALAEWDKQARLSALTEQ